MGLNIASLSHPLPLSLISTEMLDSLQLSIICLVSRNYYVKQMPNNNKMAFSQLPY